MNAADLDRIGFTLPIDAVDALFHADKPVSVSEYIQRASADLLHIVDTLDTKPGRNAHRVLATHASDRVSELILGDGSRYQVEKHLGAGSYGIVAKVMDEHKIPYILKRMDTHAKPSLDRRCLLEILLQHIVSRWDHDRAPFAPRIHTVATLGGVVYILMEFIEGADVGTVFQSQSATDFEAQASIFRMAMLGVTWLGTPLYNKFVFQHNDMKPDNLFLDRVRGKILLIDFGFAQMMFEYDPAHSLNANTYGDRYHPTKDGAMLAVAFRRMFTAAALGYPRIVGPLCAMLCDAQCDTTRAAAAGSLPVHAPHSMTPGPGHLLNETFEWSHMYGAMQHHNILGCLPSHIVAAFEEHVV